MQLEAEVNYLHQVYKLIENQVYNRNNALTLAVKEDGTNAVPWQQPQHECLIGNYSSFLWTTHIATAGNFESEEGGVILFGITDSNHKASLPTPVHYTKTDQGSSRLRKSDNFMDELSLKLT